MIRKTRRLRSKRGGGRSKVKQGIVGRYTMKPTKSFFRKENVKTLLEQQKRNAVVKQNVSKLLTNMATNDDLDPEWPDRVFEKFTNFYEKLGEIEDEMFDANQDTSDIAILKIDIATKLIELFGMKGAEPMPQGDKIAAFDEGLDELLGRFSKVGL
jgi:hypothetical protein